MLYKLNHEWHKQALWVFFFISISHLAEHLFQLFQIYVLGWMPAAANGALGLLFPWLISSEILHYLYALVMLVFLIVLRNGFHTSSRFWWNVALWIQVWHHLEHLLLLTQYCLGYKVISVLQLLFPRVELHFAYNILVFVPMVIALYEHQKDIGFCNCHNGSRLMDNLAIGTLGLIAIAIVWMGAIIYTLPSIEREVLLTPGGKYTQADIISNGNITASEKYRGFEANHDFNPQPGDILCPITKTKANPACTWIVDGKEVQFCCPPCIIEYVKLVK